MNYMLFLWAILYSGVFTLSEWLCTRLCLNNSYICIAAFTYIVAFVVWINKNNKQKTAGLLLGKIELKSIITMLPLLVFPIYNLWISDGSKVTVYTAFIAIIVAFVEEIFFRGFIQNGFIQKNFISGILKTNIIFSLYHMVNIFSGNDIEYVVWQMICAFVIGICYSFVAMMNSSIIPSAILHCMINITGISVDKVFDIKMLQIVLFYIIYAFILLKKCSKIYYKQEIK